MATEAPPVIPLPVRRTFLDEEEDPFMYDDRDYEEDMAVLARTGDTVDPVEETAAPTAAACTDDPNRPHEVTSQILSGAKRRRLIGKQRPPGPISSEPVEQKSSAITVSFNSPDSSSKLSSGQHSSEDFCDDVNEDENPELWRRKWRQAFFLLRKFFYNSPELHDHEKLCATANHEERKTAVFAQFGKCVSSNMLVSVANAALQSEALSAEDKECIRIRYITAKAPQRKPRSREKERDDFFNARFGLFTYHDEKWILQRPSLEGCSIDVVVAACKTDRQVLTSWSRLQKEVGIFCSTHGNPKFGSSFEICTSTWKEKQELKLHYHVCFKFADRMHFRTSKSLELDGVIPVHVQQPPRDCVGPRAANVNPMLYYLEMPKIGKVLHQTTVYAFTDYSVNPRWITGWLQGMKIRPEDAAKVILYLPLVNRDV
jgi:hypothetical protein